MPYYQFQCPDGHSTDLFRLMAEAPGDTVPCEICGDIAYRNWRGISIDVFKPIKTDAFTGHEIEIGSKRERDILLKESHLTMDDYRYTKGPPAKKRQSANLTQKLKEVMPAIMEANRKVRHA